MRLPAEFSDDRFLDAFRDILRDTLTTATITVLLVITVKRMFPGPDLVDILLLFILIPVSVLILCWYIVILNRSIMTLEDTFRDSRYFKYWRALQPVLGPKSSGPWGMCMGGRRRTRWFFFKSACS